MSTFLWLLLCFALWMRGSNHKARAKIYQGNWSAARSGYLDLVEKYNAAVDVINGTKGRSSAPVGPRDPEIVTKLRDRAISIEKQLFEAQDEIKKRNKMIAVLQTQIPKKAKAS